MKKLSSSKLVLAMLFAVISISANAQLKMSSNGYLTFGPTKLHIMMEPKIITLH